MNDKIEQAAKRIWYSRSYEEISWEIAITLNDSKVDTFRKFAAAALAETGWRPISELPECCPEWGLTLGCWGPNIWVTTSFRFGNLAAEKGQHTHFYLHPAPPPREKVDV